ncbi:unnamed protein product [Diatraea saccharalis]|uniref:Uncharacterized protein n=1 Tax=Diatraea saccharalis TaxID=40085 RepID=A0A9N9R611_9NEOP|nr:unnamed protein product [Diatraea saccharalis]
MGRSFNPSNADYLFPLDDDVDDQFPQQQQQSIQKKKRKHSPVAGTSRASPAPVRAVTALAQPTGEKKKKHIINPVAMKKPTANDLFGSESEDEVSPPTSITQPGNKPIHSYITRRLASGYSRQVDDAKRGTHYIDLRVYRCDEIEHVQPMNRWRHSIVCVKTRTNDNTETWQLLTNFISATRKEYRNCSPTFISNYY